jgi:hypothetical protein
MILQIPANAGQMMRWFYAMLAKIILIANTRQHQNLRGPNRTSRQNNLATGFDSLAFTANPRHHGDGAFAVKFNFVRMSMRNDMQILARSDGL